MAFEIIDANSLFGPWPVVMADMSVERLTGTMTKLGVSKTLALSTVGIMHNHGDGNAETFRLTTDQQMLIPVATIDPRGYFGNSGMINKLVEQGYKMLRFFPVFQEWNPNHYAFLDVLDEAESSNLPIMVQAHTTGLPSSLADHIKGKSSNFILEGVSFENMTEAVSVMRKNENVLVDTRAIKVPGALRFLVDQIGADRILFGSGSMRASLAAALSYIKDSDISDENKEKILGDNMRRLLEA